MVVNHDNFSIGYFLSVIFKHYFTDVSVILHMFKSVIPIVDADFFTTLLCLDFS